MSSVSLTSSTCKTMHVLCASCHESCDESSLVECVFLKQVLLKDLDLAFLTANTMLAEQCLARSGSSSLPEWFTGTDCGGGRTGLRDNDNETNFLTINTLGFSDSILLGTDCDLFCYNNAWIHLGCRMTSQAFSLSAIWAYALLMLKT